MSNFDGRDLDLSRNRGTGGRQDLFKFGFLFECDHVRCNNCAFEKNGRFTGGKIHLSCNNLSSTTTQHMGLLFLRNISILHFVKESNFQIFSKYVIVRFVNKNNEIQRKRNPMCWKKCLFLISVLRLDI